MKFERIDQSAAPKKRLSVSFEQRNVPAVSTSAWTAHAVRSSAAGRPGQPRIST